MAGRPTDYNPEMLIKAQEYLKTCEDFDAGVGDSVKLKVNLPKIEGLAIFMGVARDTLYKWAEVHREFSDILDQVKEKQAQRLIDNGLSGDYNSTITKLLLSKHGYVDKSESDNKHDVNATITGAKFIFDGNPIPHEEPKTV